MVASLPQTQLSLGGGANRIIFTVTGGGVVARLYQEDNIWKADQGRVFGRLKLSDMFYAISTFRDGAGNAICKDNVIYQQLKTGLCTLPDILSEVGSAADDCDAVSVGMGFEAVQARLGTINVPLPLDGGCPDGTSPADDVCDPW
ncbi:MAG: hypothetical protein JRI23_04165 [Deltaproteobacteria bacterium]|nr:hypothetical protein [Deltaproteobacteria bacterium]MBW2530722.1 hypothetical protein [Deltaproteobacteria bacterium]